ncbi:MAG: ThuA domain-containing protein [Chitinophagaceae bacterium]
MKRIFWLYLLFTFFYSVAAAQHQYSTKKTRFSVIAIAENSGHHIDYSKAAKIWLNKLAADSSFSIHYIENTSSLSDSMLATYQLFIQLDYPPYGWTMEAAKAFKKYIGQGKGGWIGFHHASLLGEFDGYPMWEWFSRFMGGIRYKNYIAGFVSAHIITEDKNHPCMKDIPATFTIEKDEFYTYNKSPRSAVHVIASVDESTYAPASAIKMGDHPVIWSNEKVAARNLYIFMGHSPDLFNNAAYTTLFRNAIFWAAKKAPAKTASRQ